MPPMVVDFDTRIKEVVERIGTRKLVWAGTRGADAAPLLSLPQFTESYCIIAPLRAASVEDDITLEMMSGRRVDLDRYDIGYDDSVAAARFRRLLLSALQEPCVVLPYSTNSLLTSLYFANLERVEFLGLSATVHARFDYKPWVETSLRASGIQTVPWAYVVDERHFRVMQSREHGPLVVRRSRTSGGVGIERLEPGATEIGWPGNPDELLAVSPYWPEAVPVNIGACVFPDATVVVHPPSVQLIGISACTDRVFGYCGNDFAAIKSLSNAGLDAIDAATRGAGNWLASAGFVGAFGLDLLVRGDAAYVAEINPRMQGSSSLSAMIARSCEMPDIYVDHLAAFLRLEATGSLSVRDWIARQPDVAQVIAHNTGDSNVRVVHDAPPLDLGRSKHAMWPGRGISVEPGGVLFRLVDTERVTDRGFDLLPEVAREVQAGIDRFERVPWTTESTTGEQCHFKVEWFV